MAGPETDSAKPKPEAAKTSAAGGGDATRYVGTPAVGTSKAAAAAGLATVGPEASQVNQRRRRLVWVDRKSTRLNSSHANISYAVFCLKKNKTLTAARIADRGCHASEH